MNGTITIKQNEKEGTVDFIKRIIEEKNKGTDVIGEFTNGLTVSTEETEDLDESKLYSKLLNEYGQKWDEYNRKVESDELNITENAAEKYNDNLEKFTSAIIENSEFNGFSIEDINNKIEENNQAIIVEKEMIDNLKNNFEENSKKDFIRFASQIHKIKENKNSITENYNAEKKSLEDKIEELKEDQKEQAEKYKEEFDNYEAKINEFIGLAKNNDPTINEYFTKHKNQKLTNYIKKVAGNIGPDAIKVLSEIEHARWGIEAYEEYLEYTNNEINSLNEELENKTEQFDNDIAMQDEKKRTLSSDIGKYGKFTINEENKKIPSFDINSSIYAEDLKKSEERIASLEEENNMYVKHPKNTEKNIRKLMEDKAPVEVIASELDKLSEVISDPNFNMIFVEDEKRNESITEAYNNQLSLVNDLTTKIDTGDYINHDEILTDQAKKERLDKKVKKLDEKIKNIEEEIEDKSDLSELKQIKKTINKNKKLMNKTEQVYNKYVLVNKSTDEDEQAVLYTNIIGKYNENIKTISSKADELKVEKASILPINILKARLEKTKEARKDAMKKYKEFSDSLIDKDYIDNEQLEIDKFELDEATKALELLEKKKNYLENTNIADIKYQIIEEYRKQNKQEQEKELFGEEENDNKKKDKATKSIETDIEVETKKEEAESLNETIPDIDAELEEEDFEEILPKKSIIEKIKSAAFKNKAVKALLAIATGTVLAGSNAKAAETVEFTTEKVEETNQEIQNDLEEEKTIDDRQETNQDKQEETKEDNDFIKKLQGIERISTDESRIDKDHRWMTESNAKNVGKFKDIDFSIFYSKNENGDYVPDEKGEFLKISEKDNNSRYISLTEASEIMTDENDNMINNSDGYHI